MSTDRYSIFSVLRETLRGHTGWGPAWRDAEPKFKDAVYAIIIMFSCRRQRSRTKKETESYPFGTSAMRDSSRIIGL